MSSEPQKPADLDSSTQDALDSVKPLYNLLGTVIAVGVVALAVSLSPALRSIFSNPSSLLKNFSRPMASVATSNGHANGHTNGNGIASQALNATKRPWNARGHADHGWLYTYHSFSFASYYDPSFQSYGPLRVINEDRVEKGTGFGEHSHAEFLIWSYIVKGELEHKDSMGNLEYLRRGEVQFTSAGTGIAHSEYNRNKNEDVHFLQIWAKPNVRGLKPTYHTAKYTDEMKTDKLCRIMESTDRAASKDGAAKEEGSPIPLAADISMDASILSPGKSVVHELVKEGRRKLWVHLIMSGKTQPKTGGAKIKFGNQVLGEGDGAFVETDKSIRQVEIESVGEKPAEFLLFDMTP